jgi:signal transduction histidine kinase
MNGILGFVNLLENSEISSENYKQYVGLVRKSSERLLDTINDIIEISKIQAKAATLNVTAFDLNESVRFLFDFFKPAANEKKLSLSLKNTVADKKIRLQTDKIKLESILSNLIKNAIKFTHEGSIEFGVQQDNNAIRFYVKDTGIGIPVERQNVIFERFTQADLTITKPYEGSGLGLSISKAYADLLGGEIFVESEEGKGSTFSFTLPYELV